MYVSCKIRAIIELYCLLHGSIKALLPGQGLLPSSICHITVVPVPASMQSMPLNEDDAIIEANGNVQIKDNEIFVMQGHYRNPGMQQSRSARFGPGLRSEEAAMGIVLAWMEFQHSQATARRVAEFLSSNECFMFVVMTE